MGYFINNLKSFVSIPTALVNDARLSGMAKYTFMVMASKPSSWTFHTRAIAEEMGCNIETLRRYLKELEQAGWITREEQSRTKRGFGSANIRLNIEPNTGKPSTENPSTENPCTENAAHSNNYINNNNSIKEERNISSSSLSSSPCRYDDNSFLLELRDMGVSADSACRWMEIRRINAASNTKAYMLTLKDEFKKAFDLKLLTPEECIRYAVCHGRYTFKAEDVRNMPSNKVEEPYYR